MLKVITTAICVVIMWSGVSLAAERLYVALNGGSGVAIVDLPTLDAWGVIDTGKQPAFIKVSPDRKYLLVTIYGEDKVQVIDIATDRVIKDIPVGKEPYALDISPDGNYAVVGNSDDKTVSIIDLKSLAELGRINCMENILEIKFSPYGQAYLVATEGEMYVLDVPAKKIVKTIQIPKEVYQIEFYEDGRKLFLNSLYDKEVSLMDLKDNRIINRVKAGIQGLSVSPDGKEIWFGGPGDKITAYSIKEGKVIGLLPRDKDNELYLAFSDDGKKVFASPAGADVRKIYIYSAKDKKKEGEISLSNLPRGFVYVGKLSKPSL